jgi:tetratricopeptide (TPR) repeat protein
MGGIGKTALALKLADALAPQYPDAQFFLDLNGAAEQQPLTPAEAMRHVILSIEPAAKLPDDPQQLGGMYHSLLAGRRALLLWDNARDAEQVRPLLARGCLALVTSRQTFGLPGMEALDLETLSQEEASALIHKIAERVKPDEAGEIAALCDGLPLAIRLAAGALQRPDLNVTTYLQRLQGSKTRLGLVEGSLGLSEDLLGNTLRPLFRQAGVFPAPFEREAAAAVWGLEAQAADDALGELLGRSLLDYDAPSDRYDLHDLARLFAADRLAKDEALAMTAVARHADYYLGAARACSEEYSAGRERRLPAARRFREIRPHLEAAWGRMDAGWGEQALHPAGAERWLADLPNACLNLLPTLRPPSWGSVVVLERAVRAARELGDHTGEADTLYHLAWAYESLGEPRRQIELLEQRLEIARELGDRELEARALNSLALAYQFLGEPRRQIELLEQHLEIARELGDRRFEANAMQRTGPRLYDLGQKERGVALVREALQIYSEIDPEGAEMARFLLKQWGEA